MSLGRPGAAEARVDARKVTVRKEKAGAQVERHFKRLHGALEMAKTREQGTKLKMSFWKFVAQSNGEQGVTDPGFDIILTRERNT
jgi:hypothetical protein